MVAKTRGLRVLKLVDELKVRLNRYLCFSVVDGEWRYDIAFGFVYFWDISFFVGGCRVNGRCSQTWHPIKGMYRQAQRDHERDIDRRFFF